MYRNPDERGTRRPIQRRTGLKGLKRWGGMVPDGDAANMEVIQFRDLQNVNFVKGNIDNRGGQEKLNSGAAISGCIFGMIDMEDSVDTRTKLYVLGSSGGVGDLLSFSEDDDPDIQVVLDHQSLSMDEAQMFIRDGLLHVNLGGSAYQLVRIATESSVDMADAAGESVRKVFALDWTTTVNWTPGDGKTYLVVLSDKIYSWDGTTIAADSSAINMITITKYREDLYAMGTNELRQRSGGTWGTIALPGGITSVVSSVAGAAEVYKDVLYTGWVDTLGGGNFAARIISYNGTTTALAQTPGGGGGTNGRGIYAFLVAFGYLYYLWREPNNGRLILGRFDGSTWTNTHMDLGAEASLGSPTEANGMVQFNSNIYIALTDRLIVSNGSTTTSWSVAASSINVLSDVNSLIVY